jgi:hypothetical protein
MGALTPTATDASPTDLNFLAPAVRSLQKHAEVLGYACHVARTENLDEADAVELIVRLSALDRETIRRCSSALGALGYTVASDRLHKLAATNLALGKRLTSRYF